MLQRELGVTGPAALGAIRTLVDAGVIAKVSGNRRDRKYAATEILAELDEFAVRAGRRSGY